MQYIGAIGSDTKLGIAPTKFELSEALNIHDIIFSGSQAAGEVIGKTRFEFIFELVNYRFAQMFGYKSPKEFLALVENIYQPCVHPEERASVLEKIKTKNFLDDVEIQFWNRDDEIVLARVSVRAIEDQTKGIIYEGFMEAGDNSLRTGPPWAFSRSCLLTQRFGPT